jgi:FlgD Ig-like domain/FG-GAP repeat
VNGDGVGDLLVGAPGDGGLAYLFAGSPSRSHPELRRARVFQPEVPTVTFGHAVTSVGDLDKDGYGDLLVGAPQHSGGQTNEGGVWLFRGSIDGGELVPWWQVESNVTEARFGTCLARLGDPNVDGWPDFAVGSPYEGTGGTVHVFEGGGRGLSRFVSQRVPGVISGYLWMTGTSSHPSTIECESGLRSAAGRVQGFQEVHVRTQREPWTAGAHQFSGPYDSGAPQPGFGSVRIGVQAVAGLVPAIAYVWRERTVVRSPHFPHTPWSQPRSHETGEQHFRVPGSVVAADPPPAGPAGVRLAGIEPSPFRDAARIRYALPRDGAMTLDVFDARGRHVRRLAAGPAAVGEHAVAFDGRDGRGHSLAAGVYFVTLDQGGERATRKLVRLP